MPWDLPPGLAAAATLCRQQESRDIDGQSVISAAVARGHWRRAKLMIRVAAQNRRPVYVRICDEVCRITVRLAGGPL